VMLKQAVAQWNVDLIPHGQELGGIYL